jgi:MFS family permease
MTEPASTPASPRTPADRPPRSGAELRRDLKLSTTDAMLFSVMVGLGEAYFVAFALALGMRESLSGLLATAPMLTAAVVQLIAPWAIGRLKSHKRWVAGAATLQALSFAPLIWGAWTGRMPDWAIFAAVGFYWITNLAGGPAWNTWIGTVVPPSVRPRYFASRTRLSQILLVVSLIVAGASLHFIDKEHRLYPEVYALLFLAAGIARFGSAMCHWNISEPEPMPKGQRRVPLRQFLKGPKAVSGGRVLLYMLAVQLCVQISGPFFSPYMLKQLHLDYAVFAALMCCSFLGRILAMPVIGRFAKKHGPRNLLWIGGLGILPLSAVWVVADSWWHLVIVQLVSGVLWGCYEMGTTLLLFDTIPSNERTSVLTTQTLLNALCMLVGSAAGAWMLRHFGENARAYHILFLVSGVMRIATIPLLAAIHIPSLAAGGKRWRVPVFRTVSVRPQFGGVDRPVLTTLDEETGK